MSSSAFIAALSSVFIASAWANPLANMPLETEADAIILAQEAVRTNQYEALTVAENFLQLNQSPLSSYPRYWWLLKTMPTATQADVQNYLNQYPNQSLSERVRIEWLKQLGKQKQWRLWNAEYEKLDLNAVKDAELDCYKHLESFERGALTDAALSSAIASYQIGRSASAGCISLHTALRAQNIITPNDTWKRFRLAMTANNPKLAQVLAQFLGETVSPAELSAPHANNLNSQMGRELALAHVQRLASNSTAHAQERLEILLRAGLPEMDAAYAWGQLGLISAKRLDMYTALYQFERANPQELSHEQWEWWARAALRTLQWSKLLTITQAMPEPLGKSQTWQYWQARALSNLGRQSEADALYRSLTPLSTFYGLLAREELAQPVWQKEWTGYSQDVKTLQDMRMRPNILRSLALFRIGESMQRPALRDEARREWRYAMRNLNDRQLLAASEIARQVGFYEMAIFSAERTQSTHDYSLRYLAPLPNLRHYAANTQLDLAWVNGLIRQESRFVHIARSSVGATGLMQVMPATGKWIATQLNVQNYSLNHIDTNMQFGTWYLRHVQNSLSNHPVLATAAYNAGPGRARRWQDARSLEGAIYAETIPFNETRDYVKRVMANAVYYGYVLGTRTYSLKERMGQIPPRP